MRAGYNGVLYPFGADFSHWNSSPELQKYHEQTGMDFFILKCTEGTTAVDPTTAARVTQVKAMGCPSLLYHFCDKGQDGSAQVAHFFANAGPLAGHLNPAIDVELDGPQRPGVDPRQYCEMVSHIKDGFKAETGRFPALYTYGDMLLWMGEQNIRDCGLTDCPLWWAGYPRGGLKNPVPTVPVWGVPKIWQYTDRGGFQGDLDLDIWCGTLDDMKAHIL